MDKIATDYCFDNSHSCNLYDCVDLVEGCNPPYYP